jgi:hypothetical protein
MYTLTVPCTRIRLSTEGRLSTCAAQAVAAYQSKTAHPHIAGWVSCETLYQLWHAIQR